MFLVGTVTYPPNKAVEMANKFVKAAEKSLPSFMKRLYVLSTAGGDLGVKVLGIYEADDTKVKEGFKELTKYYLQNFGDVEGFRYDIDAMLPALEAIPLVVSKL